MNDRIALNIDWMFRDTEVPAEERYRRTRQAGFAGIEVVAPYDVPAEDIAARLARHRLELVHFYAPYGCPPQEHGLGCVPGRESDFITSVEEGLRIGERFGGPPMGIHMGLIRPGDDREARLDTLRRNLARASRIAADAGVPLVIEPVSRVRIPDFALHRFAEGVALLKEIGEPNLKLVYDTFHLQAEGEPVLGTLQNDWDFVGHIQISNTPNREEPGAGELDLEWIMRQARKLGWTNWISCEFRSSTGDMAQALKWAEKWGIKPIGA